MIHGLFAMLDNDSSGVCIGRFVMMMLAGLLAVWGCALATFERKQNAGGASLGSLYPTLG